MRTTRVAIILAAFAVFAVAMSDDLQAQKRGGSRPKPSQGGGRSGRNAAGQPGAGRNRNGGRGAVAVPVPSAVAPYGGYGYGGGTTAAGSAGTGMANVISAQGDYNLSTSEAAINMTQAQSAEIQNRQEYTNTYFEMRATNKAARAAEEGPPPTAEEMARMAQEGAPKSLDKSQLDPVTGSLSWPTLLQDESFASQREVLDELSAKQSRDGALGLTDQKDARKAIQEMYSELKAQIRDVAPQDYAEARSFLRSLTYLTTHNDLSRS